VSERTPSIDLDRDQFRSFYDRWYNVVLAVAISKTRSQMEAEDIAQEVFIKLWRTVDSTKLDTLSKPFVVSSVTHMIIDRIRHSQSSAGDPLEKKPISVDAHGDEVRAILDILVDSRIVDSDESC